MTTPRFTTALALAGVLLLGGCGKEKLPDRDQIPILKKRIYDLQEAVKMRNLAAIDSLMSVKIMDYHESSDSLLRFVFGEDDSFAFQRFGNCQINYTRSNALIECYLMDSASTDDRPVLLSFVRDGDLWLLERFSAGQLRRDEEDTTGADTGDMTQ